MRREEMTVRAGIALGMGVATGGWAWPRGWPHMAQYWGLGLGLRSGSEWSVRSAGRVLAEGLVRGLG